MVVGYRRGQVKIWTLGYSLGNLYQTMIITLHNQKLKRFYGCI